MSSQPSPAGNHLLAALPAAELDALAGMLEWVPMPLGELLYEPGEKLKYAYFPVTAIASLHYVMATGASAETASVGNEGVIGLALFLGGDTTTSSAVVRTAGHAYRMAGHVLAKEFNRAGSLRTLLLRYLHALMTQMSLNVACNRHHAIEQQLCRWLLSTFDRGISSEVAVTQELIATMLGVRREGVTDAAGNLQRAGLIRYRRGHISVLEIAGLEARACECYGVVKSEMKRLLTDLRAHKGKPGEVPRVPRKAGLDAAIKTKN